MIRSYAYFSASHRMAHLYLILMTFAVFVFSAWSLLSNENLVYAAGVVGPVVPLILFAKASDYRRAYVHD